MHAIPDEARAVDLGELAAVRLFRGLDDDQRAEVLASGELLAADPGEIIVEEGTTGSDLFVLLSGSADVTVRIDIGDTLDVGSVQAGESFGELGALLRERRAATVVAAEPCRLLRIGADELPSLLERIGPLGLALSRAVARDLATALGERNELHVDATPTHTVTPPENVGRLRSQVARHYLATARSVLRRERLLTDGQQPVYRAEALVTEEELARWYHLFGALPDGATVPFTCYVTSWTALLLQVAEDLGVNLRKLAHSRTRLRFHPEGGAMDPGRVYGVQVRVVKIAPRSPDTVALTVDTYVSAPDGTRIVAATDTFTVTDVDRDIIKQLGTSASGPGTRDAQPAESPDDPLLLQTGTALAETAVVLADDLGVRYGKLSGNLSPLHTSRTGARLLGHDRPFLQHLCVANLVLQNLTSATGHAPAQLDLDFRRPVYPGSTVLLRRDDARLEVLDDEEELLVTGAYHAADVAASLDHASSAHTPPDSVERPIAAAPGETATTADGRDGPAGEEPPGGALMFDVSAMQHLLDGDYRQLRARVRQLLCTPEFARTRDLSRDEYRERVLAWCRLLADQGLGALAAPREVGGADDPAGAIAVFETLAEHDLSLVVKYGVQFGLFGGAVLHLGTERHYERYLRRIYALELPGCFALTETGHGSNARAIRTRAVYDPETQQYVITTPDDHARKDYIGNAARHGRLAVVFAQLEVNSKEEGVHAFLVPIRDEQGLPSPGVRIEDCGSKIGLNGVDNGRLWFDGVRVGWGALLDRYGHVSIDGVYSSPIDTPGARFFTMLSTLVQGRISVGLAALSATRSALTIAVRYGDRRRQFGPPGSPETPLLDYLTHQRRLFIPLATTYALHVSLRELVDDYVAVLEAADPPPRQRIQLETLGAGLKAMATWHATATIQECREACGGQGYLSENRFGDLKADSDIFTTFEGDNTVLLQLVTKTLLTDYKQQFEDMDTAATIRFLTARVLSAALPTPAARRSDQAHLRDRSFHLQAFRDREQLQLEQLARRLRRTIGEGADPHAAFIRHQSRIVQVAMTHIERVVLERFTATVESCSDRTLAPVLSRLCDLYALSHLKRERGWYQEHGLFAASKARAIIGQVDELCRELRPHARDLVDAFGVPDELLAAPIAAATG